MLLKGLELLLSIDRLNKGVGIRVFSIKKGLNSSYIVVASSRVIENS